MNYNYAGCKALGLRLIKMFSEDYIKLKQHKARRKLNFSEDKELKETTAFFLSENFEIFKGDINISGVEFLELLDQEINDRKKVAIIKQIGVSNEKKKTVNLEF